MSEGLPHLKKQSGAHILDEFTEIDSIDAEEKNKEKLRDRLFEQLIAARVLDSFIDDLVNSNFPEDALQQFEREFALLPEHAKAAVLAIPAQLRPIQFSRYAQKIESGEMSGTQVLHDILNVAKARGYTLGFHLSLYDITKEKDGSWMVKGTEPDHRHNDMPMAYYSRDYSHRYKMKRVQYLYVIRAEIGENTSHFQDNDGSWGHASSLSIVEKIDMPEIERELNRKFNEIYEKAKEGDT